MPSNPVKQTTPARELVVAQARLEPWADTVRVQGSLLAYEDSTIGSKLAGRVETVAVDLGSRVRRGAHLVSLIRDELQLRVQLAEAQLRQACAPIGILPADDESKFDFQQAPGVMLEQALVEEAQRNVERAGPLVESRAMSQGEYDTLVAQLRAAQARYHAALNTVGEQVSLIGVRRKELALAQRMLADAQIVAPFDGVVGQRRISPGEYVQAGQPVVSIVQADRLRFTAGVPESHASVVRVGQQIEIQIDASRERCVTTTISRVSPTVVQSSRSLLIEADVPNQDLILQAGAFAEADVIVNADAQAIVVPASAVSRFAGVQKVWLVSGGVARQQTVRIGRMDSARAEVIEGLAAGTTVVRDASVGYDGPVIAIGELPVTNLHAQSPESSPPVPSQSTGGAG